MKPARDSHGLNCPKSKAIARMSTMRFQVGTAKPTGREAQPKGRGKDMTSTHSVNTLGVRKPCSSNVIWYESDLKPHSHQSIWIVLRGMMRCDGTTVCGDAGDRRGLLVSSRHWNRNDSGHRLPATLAWRFCGLCIVSVNASGGPPGGHHQASTDIHGSSGSFSVTPLSSIASVTSWGLAIHSSTRAFHSSAISGNLELCEWWMIASSSAIGRPLVASRHSQRLFHTGGISSFSSHEYM